MGVELELFGEPKATNYLFLVEESYNFTADTVKAYVGGIYTRIAAYAGPAPLKVRYLKHYFGWS